jgi:hypothetical protein
MTHLEFIEKIKTEFLINNNCMIISDWQLTSSNQNDYVKDNIVFCEIITTNENKRNIIRISSSAITKEKIPAFIKIDVLNVIYRSPSHPNIPSHEIKHKIVFNGKHSSSDTKNEFSYPVFIGLLNCIEGFFN